MNEKADLILHPVRLRIIIALNGQEMTPQEMAVELGDVPQATLYRHIKALNEGGVITVVAERQVHSVTESVYALADVNAGVLGPEEAASMSPDDHMRVFTVFISSLLAEFSRYLEGDDIDLVRDMISYQQVSLLLSDEELMVFLKDLNRLFIPLLDNKPRPDRRRRLLSTILIPGKGSK